MSLKSAEQWTVSLNSELCTIPAQRTRSDPEAIRATIQAAQADALRYAAELCRKRILRIKNGAHNIACTECSITLQAAAHELESGLGVTLYPVKDIKEPEL